MYNIIPNPVVITKTNGFCNNSDNIIINKTHYAENDEEYSIDINESSIIVTGTDKGTFYAHKTIEMLHIVYNGKIPCCHINDAPVFGYRGFMLDSARHFQSVNEIKKIIDIAALLKFNRFHWHLSDDQGFRIELKTLSDLTEKGSVREKDGFGKFCRNNNKYSGYYTQNEIKDIISYCKERYIEVIPEIDIPGHTSAILHTYPQLSCNQRQVEVKCTNGIFKDILCAGNEETIIFLKKLFDEICEIFPGKYIHIGGDEAPKDRWEKCTYCQNKLKNLSLNNYNELQIWLCHEIKNYLKTKGKKCIVWNDILKGGTIDKDIVIQRWLDRKHLTKKAVADGSKVILSNFYPYYLDYSYGQNTLKKIYEFSPEKEYSLNIDNIKGIEAPIWTEFINNDERLEYLLFPRLFAVAERAWNGSKIQTYSTFRASCDILSAELIKRGYNVAPCKDWNMSPANRIADIIKFYFKFIYIKEQQ